MPTYNQLRTALGLAPVSSYVQVTGESTSAFPSDVNQANPIDDPAILAFDKLFDLNGNPTTPDAENAVVGVRHSTLAARLRAIYGAGNAGKMDAFVGMVSEAHAPGSELGPTQLALWTQQFEALRDGDRFFYLNDPLLVQIRLLFGIDYRKTLAQVIRLDTGTSVPADVFHIAG
jgi:peroxidase